MDKLLTPRGSGGGSARLSLSASGGLSSPRKSRRDTATDAWYAYTVLKGPLDSMMLERWSRTIALARQAGQFSCALMLLRESRDYFWIGTKFSLAMQSPVHDLEDDWVKVQRIRFKVHVPLREGRPLESGAVPAYPADYCRFGYLTATWFQPYDPGMRIDNEGVELEARLADFDAVRYRAQMCGQMECVLMQLQGGPDYTTKPAGAGYKLDARFACVERWALNRGVRLVVKVPSNPLVYDFTYSAPHLCDFGHLVANWEVPIDYQPEQRYSEPVPGI